MWGQLIEKAIAKPAETALVCLALAVLCVAAAFARRSMRRNGNGNGDETAALLDDLEGLGLPKPVPVRQKGMPFVAAGAVPMVSEDTFRATVSGIHGRIRGVTSEVTELRERVVKVEQTCDRTEKKVDALPQQFGELLAAQTVQLQQSQQKQLLAAFEALDKQLDQKIADALKR